MVYLIYDFEGLKITNTKYQQFLKTLFFACKESSVHHFGNINFGIRPVNSDYNICVEPHSDSPLDTLITSTTSGSAPEGISRLPDPIHLLPIDMKFSTVRIFDGSDLSHEYKKCILCTIDEADANFPPGFENCKIKDAIVYYAVGYDVAHINAQYGVNLDCTDVVQKFILHNADIKNDKFRVYNPDVGWSLNSCFWYNTVFSEPLIYQKFDCLVGFTRLSMVGLYYDKFGKDSDDAWKNMRANVSGLGGDLLGIDNLRADIYNHFACKLSDVDDNQSIDDDLKKEKEKVEQHFEAHGGCGYMSSKYDEKMIKKNDEQRKVCRIDKDPCKPPKWLTNLYNNPIDNDGELPEKVKLHRLLSYMADYTASWTECCDAHSAQQMKDILPLLMRCKLILEGKK